MSKKNALRRLSVIWRLKEAFEPSPTSPAPDTPTISKFLSISKTNFLKDVKEDPAKGGKEWTVVMGNEAGGMLPDNFSYSFTDTTVDLDSIASSIAYAWVLSEVKKTPAVALIQLERADLNLRAENLHAFKLAGLTDTLDELLTLSEISEFQPVPFEKFVLVDHNRLGTLVNRPEVKVVSIFDHHDDEGLYLDASPRIISPVGSCASLIATQLPSEPLADLAFLLLSAILIDTDGLKPGGKAVQADRDSALILAPKSTIANSIPPLSALSPIDHPNPDALFNAQAIKDLTKTLKEKKSEVSHLSPFDLIRRDYKEYTHTLSWATGSPAIKVGLSTVVSGLKSWASDGALEQAVVRWMRQRNITILGVCTSFRDTKKMSRKSDKGKHKREQAWFVLAETELANIPGQALTTDVLAKHLWTGLEAAATLQLEKYKRYKYLEKSSRLPPESRAKAYKQKNVDASRKEIAPLVKSLLESPLADDQVKKD